MEEDQETILRFVLFFAVGRTAVDTQNPVNWAKTNCTSQQKNYSNNNQHQCNGTTNDVLPIQNRN